MNIFVLDARPTIAAQMHCDKHVVKMAIEYAQLLSTAHHLNGSEPDILAHLYKPTHKNHPATKWVAQHPLHYAWVFNLADATWSEYTYRYGKVHASSRLKPWLSKVPRNLIAYDLPTPPPQCMPDNYRVNAQNPSWDDAVVGYHQYYRGAKAAFARWTKRDVPWWFTQTASSLNMLEFGEEPNGGTQP